MNGQILVWYNYGFWACFPRLTTGHHYSRPADWLQNAEAMMRGDHSDPLWRKTDESARRMVWC